MPSCKLVLACFCLLGLITLSLRVQAQDSHVSGDAVSGNSPANQEHPQDNSSGQSRVDPSPLAALTQTVSALFGPPLADAIRSTRDRVYPQGRPIPVALRRQLAPFFPRTVLEKVRYATAWDPTADLLPALFMGNSTKSAMTLGDVILFRDAHGVTDPLLWAHELTHVMQYQQLGVPAFATRYLERGWELEAEAMEKADAIGRQLSP
jgi:Domain of unknown function (DUF4157)